MLSLGVITRRLCDFSFTNIVILCCASFYLQVVKVRRKTFFFKKLVCAFFFFILICCSILLLNFQFYESHESDVFVHFHQYVHGNDLVITQFPIMH